MMTSHPSSHVGTGPVTATNNTGTRAERQPAPRERRRQAQDNSTNHGVQTSSGKAQDFNAISDLRKLLHVAAELKQIDLSLALDDYRGLLKQSRQDERVHNEETILETRREQMERLSLGKSTNEQEKYKALLQEYEKMQKENREFESKLQEMDKLYQQFIDRDKKRQNDMKKMEDELEKVKEERDTAVEEKKLTMTRLSKEMGMKLSDNNPAIADLSDPNRPAKLGEKYSELYDNDWTDALEKLIDLGGGEEASIRVLLNALRTCYRVCVELSDKQMVSLQNMLLNPVLPETSRTAWTDVGSPNMSKAALKQLKECRKEIIGDAVMERISEHAITQCGGQAYHIPGFIKKCTELCWLMCLQDPPVVLDADATVGETFNPDMFKPYTNTGTIVSFNVWPPLLLHQNGALLVKGIVQPIREVRRRKPPQKDTPASTSASGFSKTSYTPSSTQWSSSSVYDLFTTTQGAGSSVVPQATAAWTSPAATNQTYMTSASFHPTQSTTATQSYHQVTTTQANQAFGTQQQQQQQQLATPRNVPPYRVVWHDGRQLAESNGKYYLLNVFQKHYGIDESSC